VANGSFCVDENARDLFAALNDFRTKGKNSTYYTAFKAACDEVALNGSWTTSNKTVKVTTTKATAAAALSYVNAATAVTTPLNWSIGLSAAGQSLYDSWAKTGTQGLTDSSNQSSVARAKNFGDLGTSGLAEFATYMTISYFSVQDALTALIIGEGDASGTVRTNLFDSKNTVASCFNAFNGNPNKYMIEAQFARTFTDASTINSACTLLQNFGGSLCDQTGRAKDFYNAINSIRTNPNPITNALFAAKLAEWQAGFGTTKAGQTSFPMTVDINDVAGTETVATTEGKTRLDALIVALKAQAALKPLAWSAGLQYASKDWIDLVVGASDISLTAGSGTTKTRSDKYGTVATGGKDVYQVMTNKYDFNALNAVIYLLVSDGKKSSSYPDNAAILSKDYTQMATAYALSTKLASTTIYTANFADAKYTHKAGVACTTAATSTTTTTTTVGTPTGASDLLLVSASTFAVLVSALF